MLFENDVYPLTDNPYNGFATEAEAVSKVAAKFALVMRLLTGDFTCEGLIHAFGEMAITDPELAMTALDKVEEAHQADPSRGLLQR
ncbi:hypothetical protein E1264_03410 [Actinomadura sp. KC216]|uniref:hypothetical protein n=1 Tax=Actinomadura sp. KC216 TaxID=2530370 RepID=UPI001047BD78|nr:hypothetical protein [Actinomadura sp. KC216]TDB90887.1 hypothetical protein E1264_03410 [Actinomadura sp. KC216]